MYVCACVCIYIFAHTALVDYSLGAHTTVSPDFSKWIMVLVIDSRPAAAADLRRRSLARQPATAVQVNSGDVYPVQSDLVQFLVR